MGALRDSAGMRMDFFRTTGWDMVYDKRTVKTADLSGRRAAKKRQTSWPDG
jgi:hypothetical protein